MYGYKFKEGKGLREELKFAESGYKGKFYDHEVARKRLREFVDKVNSGDYIPKTILDKVEPLKRNKIELKKAPKNLYVDGRTTRTKYKSVLTEDNVRDIRSREDRTVDLAKEYGVTEGAISAVRKFKTWKHVV